MRWLLALTLFAAAFATPALAGPNPGRCGIEQVDLEYRANDALYACAEQGDPEAQAWLGLLNWSAAESDSADAADFGLRGKRSRAQLAAEGRRLIEAAANAGDVMAQNELGRAYMFGEFNIDADPAQAQSWLLRAVERGDEIAMFNIAYMHWMGLGYTRSPEESEHWLRRSVEFNYRPARCTLARVLERRGASANLSEVRALRAAVVRDDSEALPCGVGDVYEHFPD